MKFVTKASQDVKSRLLLEQGMTISKDNFK